MNSAPKEYGSTVMRKKRLIVQSAEHGGVVDEIIHAPEMAPDLGK
jgi:hypothetical protein